MAISPLKTVRTIVLKDNEKNKITISLERGECLFIVGANGSGKSALIQQCISELRRKEIDFERYSAHRQPWFVAEVTWSGETKEVIQNRRMSVMKSEASQTSRWGNPANDEIKHATTFHDLVEKCRRFNQMVMNLNTSNRPIEEKIRGIEMIQTENPLYKFNDLLKHGNIPITFEFNSGDTKLNARHNDNGLNVDIQQMSDGERFAILFAATAITLPPEAVLLIDEPDLHFHQSIINPFFSALVASRKDCFFVFSTHNLSFPSAHPDSKVVIVRSCEWVLDTPYRFDIELLGPETPIPESVSQDILGARGKILYVEGQEGSLDARLYKILFPGFTVIPKGGYSTVDKSVRGLRESESLHHAEVWGLVDKDLRSEQDIQNTIEKNIGVLNVWSVESIYYSIEAIEAVARHQVKEGNLRQGSADTQHILLSAYEILEDEEVAKIMASHRTFYKIRMDARREIAKITRIRLSEDEAFIIDVENPYPKELDNFHTAIEKKPWDALLKEYPLHKSDAFNAIARALNLDGKSYENILISLVQEDEELAQKLRQYVTAPFLSL